VPLAEGDVDDPLALKQTAVELTGAWVNGAEHVSAPGLAVVFGEVVPCAGFVEVSAGKHLSSRSVDGFVDDDDVGVEPPALVAGVVAAVEWRLRVMREVVVGGGVG
jgi:hypothetical protein